MPGTARSNSIRMYKDEYYYPMFDDYAKEGVIADILKIGYRYDKPEKDKLNDFVEEYWHFDNITCKSEKQFTNSYKSWAKKKGYHQSEAKAVEIYALAKEGIQTLDSNAPSTKMLVLESVRVLREVDKTLSKFLTQMKDLAKTLLEYSVVQFLRF